jgi:transposase
METVYEVRKEVGREEAAGFPARQMGPGVPCAGEGRSGPGVAGRPSDPEVVERPARRRFSAEYKLRILREVDGCSKKGEVGAILRREGLFSSHLTEWRRAREKGALGALEPSKRGRKATRNDPLVKENERLRKEKAALERKLKQAEILLDIQKKVSEILEIPLKSLDDEGSDS